MSDRKAVIKNADMGEEMQQDAVDCATQALEKYNIEKVIFFFLLLFLPFIFTSFTTKKYAVLSTFFHRSRTYCTQSLVDIHRDLNKI